MALSKTHILATATALYRKSKSHLLKDYIPLVILPDAIRCFPFADNIKNNRVVSHFEIHPQTNQPSWLTFPTIQELKTLTVEKIRELPMHIEPDYKQVAIGDTSSLTTFIETNWKKIDYLEFECIATHLLQDIRYDSYIRSIIDCSSRRTNQMFYFNQVSYDAKSIRHLIGEIEEQEFRVLQKIFKNETGITADQKWFEDNVLTAIDNIYCPKMAECTWKYIQILDSSIDIPLHIDQKTCENIVNSLINATQVINE